MVGWFSRKQLGRDSWLLIAAMGIWSAGYFGVFMLLRVLFALRLGYGPEFIGLYSGSGALTYMVMALPSGYISEKLGARRTMLLGATISLLWSMAQPLAEFMPRPMASIWLVVTQILMTGGWSMFSVNFVPSLTDATRPETRADVFALSGVVRGLGTFLGTMVGGVLPALVGSLLAQPLSEPSPYRYSLWLGTLVMVVALVPLARVRSGQKVVRTVVKGTQTAFSWREIAPLLLHVFLSHAGWAIPQAFWNAYMDTVLHMATATIGLVTGLGQFLGMLSPLLGPKLTRWKSHGWTMTAGALGISLGLLPLALLPYTLPASVGRLVVLAVAALWQPVLQVYQMEQVAEHLRARAYGATQMVMGMAFALVSLAGGFVIAAAGYRVAFGIGAVMSGLGAGVMWRTQGSKPEDVDVHDRHHTGE